MVGVPGGTFRMGDAPGRLVQFSPFSIGRTEVTVACYRECVEARRCTPPRAGAFCNWGVRGRNQHPVNCVDWMQADAYCRWRGGALPSRAQWELAARGTDGRPYPWGTAEPTDQLFWSGVQQRRSTTVVGSHPSGASPFGALDMAGNVWEWVADWDGETPGASGPVVNPTGPAEGTERVLCGGGWAVHAADSVRATFHFSFVPNDTGTGWGIRCMRAARP